MLIFPPRCVLCKKLLTKDETDMCHECHKDAPEFSHTKSVIPFIAHWTALWYYKENVRSSIHRFKFGNARRYANAYARQLSLKLLECDFIKDCDLVTWVPISFLRHAKRGYDQSALLAKALAKELNMTAVQTLKKVRHTAPQSGFSKATHRRANVLSAYRVIDKAQIKGKRILLVDDVVTTGSTASECAKTLMTAGAKEIVFAAIAAASHDKK